MSFLSSALRSSLAFVLAALAASSALAENARLEAAKRLYSRAELEAAMAELKAAEDSSKDDADLVTILIYKGLVFAETGQGQAMQDSFKRALAMKPWAEVPQDTSPRLAKMFQEARREVWGSSIKAWPKKKEGAAKPGDTPPAETKPAEPEKAAEPPKPAEPAATEPAKPAEPEKTAEPAKEAPPPPPPATTDEAPPDVPPSK
jgi:hypothetical protein